VNVFFFPPLLLPASVLSFSKLFHRPRLPGCVATGRSFLGDLHLALHPLVILSHSLTPFSCVSDRYFFLALLCPGQRRGYPSLTFCIELTSSRGTRPIRNPSLFASFCALCGSNPLKVLSGCYGDFQKTGLFRMPYGAYTMVLMARCPVFSCVYSLQHLCV